MTSTALDCLIISKQGYHLGVHSGNHSFGQRIDTLLSNEAEITLTVFEILECLPVFQKNCRNSKKLLKFSKESVVIQITVPQKTLKHSIALLLGEALLKKLINTPKCQKLLEYVWMGCFTGGLPLKHNDLKIFSSPTLYSF